MKAPADRVVVLFEHEANRRLLAEMLGRHYTVVAPDGEVPVDGDLYVLDRAALARHGPRLATIRRRAEPHVVPMLLSVERRDVGLATAALWQFVDDVIARPVERAELLARIETHMRTRRLSLALERLSSLYEQEHRIAERFQYAAMPQSLPNVPGIRFSAAYVPGSTEAQIGGDWYDAFRLIDGRIVITIGDVGGHGLEAAVTMSEMRQVLRGVAQINPDPEMMLEAADRVLVSQRPDCMVTAFAGVLDPLTSLFAYASAGHPRPIVRLEDGSFLELAADGIALGVAPVGKRATETIELPANAFVAFFSDGLVEATHDMAAGEARVRDALDRESVREADDVARALYECAMPPGAPRDDVAVLVMHVRDPAIAVRFDENVTRWSFDVSDAALARRARHDMLVVLAAHGVAEDDRAKAELVFGELIGNVVRHASGTTDIALDWSGTLPVLHVLDRGAGFRYLPRLPADIFSERGRGLFLISTLTDDFTVIPRPDGGSHARAVLTLSQSQRLAGRNGGSPPQPDLANR